jgi:hypothetical protein
VESGKIAAEIFSELGMPLTIETPTNGYTLVTDDGQRIPMLEPLVTVQTAIGQRLRIVAD